MLRENDDIILLIAYGFVLYFAALLLIEIVNSFGDACYSLGFRHALDTIRRTPPYEESGHRREAEEMGERSE